MDSRAVSARWIVPGSPPDADRIRLRLLLPNHPVTISTITFKDTRDMEPSLMYQAIAREDVDVVCAFATDGRIAAYNLKMLSDDKGFFPPYYAAPVVRAAVLEKHPDIRKALGPLAGLLTDETMQGLNSGVDQDKREAGDVAREFLTQHELLPSPQTQQ